MRTGGIVLCGGRSSRMGRPKVWLPVGDETMLQRVVRVVRDAVWRVVVVAAPGQDVPALPPGVSIIRDEIEGKGPLGGLAAGLAALADECDAVYLSACDMPFLTSEFVQRVVELLFDTQPDSCPPCIAMPDVEGFPHPLAAAYRVSVLPHVRDRLAADRLCVRDLTGCVPTRFIAAHELEATDLGSRSLRSVNCPEDYVSMLRELGEPSA